MFESIFECRTKEWRPVGDEQHGGTRKVRPQRVEYLCRMAFQKLEWHAVDDVTSTSEADILEIVHESGTPALDGIEPVWASD